MPNETDDVTREPSIDCEHCAAATPASDAYTVIVGGPRAGHRSCVTEQWCAECLNADSRTSAEHAHAVSEDFAINFLYYWDSDGEYHSEEEAAESDDSWDSILYCYATDILDVHGWPDQTPCDSLCFGVELEMEAKSLDGFSDMVEELGGMDGNGRYILKADGSLDDGRGAELVTLPYTLAAHRKLFRWDAVLSPRLRSLAKSGAGTTNCGIHVHVNRAAISPLTVGKLLVFLNSASNGPLVTAIAQRGSSAHCERDSQKTITSIRDDHNRYDILNVSNYRTIEFRMFRGNLRPERVLKNLEFCHSLIMFCESHGIHESGDRQAYMAYLERNAKAYPNLCAFLIEKQYMAQPHVRSTAEYAILARRVAAEA